MKKYLLILLVIPYLISYGADSTLVEIQTTTAPESGWLMLISDTDTNYYSIDIQTLVDAFKDSTISDSASLWYSRGYIDAITTALGGKVAYADSNQTVGWYRRGYIDALVANFISTGDAVTGLDGTAWRVFYTDGSGNVTELALGADGTYLMSNGADQVPSFETPSGSGDMLASDYDKDDNLAADNADSLKKNYGNVGADSLATLAQAKTISENVVADSSLNATTEHSIPMVNSDIEWYENDAPLDTLMKYWTRQEILYGETWNGSVSAGELVYFTGTDWDEVDASAEATTAGWLGIAINTTDILIKGYWTTSGLTAGNTYYASETEAGITNTKPTTASSVTRVIGYAHSTTQLYFDPDKTYTVHN